MNITFLGDALITATMLGFMNFGRLLVEPT